MAHSCRRHEEGQPLPLQIPSIPLHVRVLYSSDKSKSFSLHHLVSSNGGTVVRPVFFEYPHDLNTYNVGYQFMWGKAMMIAPVLYQVCLLLSGYCKC